MGRVVLGQEVVHVIERVERLNWAIYPEGQERKEEIEKLEENLGMVLMAK